jgi:hypothetical protein
MSRNIILILMYHRRKHLEVDYFSVEHCLVLIIQARQ